MINSNLYKNTFKKSFEIVPPKYNIKDNYLSKIIKYQHNFDLLDITCSPLAKLRISPVALAHKLILKGIDKRKLIINFSTRDKNSLALQSEILGVISMGINKLLVVKGDKINVGDSKRAQEVYEVNTDSLIQIIKNFSNGHDYNNNPVTIDKNYEIFSALNLNKSLNELKKTIQRRLKKGSRIFITQPVYSEYDFDLVAKISKNKNYKILCGVLPISNIFALNNIIKKLGGINVNSKHIRELKRMNNKRMSSSSEEYLKKLISEYKNDLDGIHVMTYGNIAKASKIVKDL